MWWAATFLIWRPHAGTNVVYGGCRSPERKTLRLLGLFGRLALALVLTLLMVIMMAAPGNIEGAAWLVALIRVEEYGMQEVPALL